MIALGIERMLLLYVATGMRLARTSIDAHLQEEGMDEQAIEQVVQSAVMRWRLPVVCSFAVGGVLLLLIRRLLNADATPGLFFSLGGVLAMFFAATATTRLYCQDKGGSRKGGGL